MSRFIYTALLLNLNGLISQYMCVGFLYSSSAGRKKPTVTTRIIHAYTIKRTGAPILLRILKTNSSSDKTEHIRQKKTANCEDNSRQHECPWPTYSCITDTAPSLNEFTHQVIERPPFLISLHVKRAHSIKDSTFLRRSEQQQDSFVGDIAAIAFVNERGH